MESESGKRWDDETFGQPTSADRAGALEVDFSDIGLLERSLVHSSFVAEFPGVFEESNEQLEFLGDSVLDLVVAEELTRTISEASRRCADADARVAGGQETRWPE